MRTKHQNPLGLDQGELKALVSLLHDDSFEVLNHVESKILSLGEGMVGLLEEEWSLSSDEPEVQKRIEELIHSIQFENLKTDLTNWCFSAKQDLLEGMWLVARFKYPTLKFEEISANLDQLYFNIWSNTVTHGHPIDQIKSLNHAFFQVSGFSANNRNFNEPSNSLINRVLETKKGNPVTLCVIYMLIAQKLKMPVFGVNLPNLFILTYMDHVEKTTIQADYQFYINVFNRGVIFWKSDIDNYLNMLNMEKNEVFYNPCTHKDIVLRVFRNLYFGYAKSGEETKKKEIAELMLILGEQIIEASEEDEGDDL